MQQKNNSGAVWPNDRKETDRHPDFTGKALIGGVEYYVSVWDNPAEQGKKRRLGLAFTDKNEADQRRQSSASAAAGSMGQNSQRPPSTALDDDIPF